MTGVRKRILLAAAAAALSAGACRSSCSSCASSTGKSPAPSAPAPAPAADSAPVPDAIQALRDADAAFQRGELDQAIQRAQAAAVNNSPVALNLLGRAHAARYEKTKDEAEAKQAREAFNQAVAASPDFWPALQNLGELDEKMGLLREAADAYRKVLKAQPQHPDRARFEAVIASVEKAGTPGKK